MPNITGHTELVGLMAYPIRHTHSPTTHNLAYDKNGDDVIQLAFEVDNDSLKDAVQSIRALKMLGSNISMPNKTVVHKYLDEVDEAAKLCGAINTVVNMRDENGQVTGKPLPVSHTISIVTFELTQSVIHSHRQLITSHTTKTVTMLSSLHSK